MATRTLYFRPELQKEADERYAKALAEEQDAEARRNASNVPEGGDVRAVESRRPSQTIVQFNVPDVIVSRERRAQVRDELVARLMRSIERRGLLSPIRVRSDGTLVCGLHRLAAHERLQRPVIDTFVCDGDDIDVELDELEENLERKDLTVLDRARHEARQKALYVLRHPGTQQGVAGAIDRHSPESVQPKALSFAESQARSGSGRRMVEQRLQIAELVADETAALIAEHEIANNHTQLLQLARVPDAQRHEVARRMVEAQITTVAAALVATSGVQEPKPPRASVSTTGTMLLARTGNELAGSFAFRGRQLSFTISPDLTSMSWADLGRVVPEVPAVVPAAPTRAAQILDIPLSTTAAAEVVAELPSDLARHVSVGAIRVEHWCACRRCGGSDFWINWGGFLRCRTCHDWDDLQPAAGDRFLSDEERERRQLRARLRRHRSLAPGAVPAWEPDVALGLPPRRCFGIAERVNIRSPRLAQDITVRSAPEASEPRCIRVPVRWWNGPNRFGNAPGSVLVEVVGGGSVLIAAMRGHRVRDLHALLRRNILGAFLATHRVVERSGRYFRSDGSEV